MVLLIFGKLGLMCILSSSLGFMSPICLGFVFQYLLLFGINTRGLFIRSFSAFANAFVELGRTNSVWEKGRR